MLLNPRIGVGRVVELDGQRDEEALTAGGYLDDENKKWKEINKMRHARERRVDMRLFLQLSA